MVRSLTARTHLGQQLLAVEDGRLDVDDELGDFGQRRDVDAQDLHSELPVAVPHGDGEDALVVLLIDGQLLVGA